MAAAAPPPCAAATPTRLFGFLSYFPFVLFIKNGASCLSAAFGLYPFVVSASRLPLLAVLGSCAVLPRPLLSSSTRFVRVFRVIAQFVSDLRRFGVWVSFLLGFLPGSLLSEGASGGDRFGCVLDG